MTTPTGIDVVRTEYQSLAIPDATSNSSSQSRYFDRTDGHCNNCCIYIVKKACTSISEICTGSLVGAVFGASMGVGLGVFFYSTILYNGSDSNTVDVDELLKYLIVGAGVGAAIGIAVENFFNCFEERICCLKTADALSA